MTEFDSTGVSQAEQVFTEVLALYSVLKGSPIVKVKRAQMKGGEVVAEPLDFIMDVELKGDRIVAQRFLASEDFYWHLLKADPEGLAEGRYEFPVYLRETLGQTFLEHRLGIDGDYRTLYYRAKNNSDREARKHAGDRTNYDSVPDSTGTSTGDQSDLGFVIDEAGSLGDIGFDFSGDTGETEAPIS